MARYDFHVRLEPSPRRRSLAAGFAAAVHDPIWFLARQWQMGEHQGENAASPVIVHRRAINTPLQSNAADPAADPKRVPAEAIVEAEPDDWWTIGRRVRLGATFAERAGLTVAAAAPHWLLAEPPPPYEQLAGRFDGLALWRDRAVIDPTDALFVGLDIPGPRPSFWDPAELVYDADFPLDAPSERSLRLPRHRGGGVDWFSADAEASPDAAPFAARGETVETVVYPTALHYPGAPASRWWEIEDAAVDIGGYPPDSSHFATSLLIDLIASHGDDWFIFPVDARAGHISTLEGVTVTDGFGRSYPLEPPTDWWLFKTTNLDPHSLVVWLRAMTPLQGQPLDNVLLGLDEYANLLWAVERRVNGRDLAPRERSDAQELANPTKAPPRRKGGDEDTKRYAYVAGRDAAPYWHPYEIEETLDATGWPRRRFVQRRPADLAREDPELMPAARAAVLRVGEGAGETVHEIEPATVPTIGMVLERRYQLARDVDGQPRLWLQRERTPFLSPPARAARFDVLADDVPTP